MNHMPRTKDRNTEAELKRIAMDYAEGWYTGDAARMEAACHPDMIKRTLIRSGDGWVTGPISTAKAMVEWTAKGGGTDWLGEPLYEIEVLDVFRDMATVRCGSPEYVDHLQLANFGPEGWKIVNVLWQLRKGDFAPSPS